MLTRFEELHEEDRRDGVPAGKTLGGGVALGELAILESAPLPVGWGFGTSVAGTARGGLSWHVELPTGLHAVEAVGFVSVHRVPDPPPDGPRSRSGPFCDTDELGEPIHRWPIRLPLTFEGIKEPPVVVTPIADPALRDAVRAAIRIERGPEAVARRLGGPPLPGFDDVLVLTVDPSSPVPVCMEVHARGGQRESFLGLLCPAQRGPMPLIVPGAQMRFAASGGVEHFDLVLRPAGEMVRDRRGVGSFWNEEIVITGVHMRVPVDDVDDRGDDPAE